MSTVAIVLLLLAAPVLLAQAAGEPGLSQAGRGQGPPPGRGGASGPGTAPQSPRAAAPIDLTGYWVSMVTDDWRYRMLTPPKGNVDVLPVTPEARRIAGEWDPAKDEAAGEQCRGYGAVGVMRLPGRLRITWASDSVLQIDADAGTQMRRFQFAAPPDAATAAPSWQGVSTARWVMPVNRAAGPGPNGERTGELRVVTNRLRPGYIRKNGVPYSGNATLTEHFVRLVDDDNTEYLAVTQLVEDPVYLLEPVIRTMLFKRQRDASGWNPTPCSAR